MKVLIVEDNENWQDMLSIWFSGKGHEVVGIAATESEALKLFEQHRPSLVTMDGNLMGTSGLQIAAAIRALDKRVKILMLTGEDIQFEHMGFSKGSFNPNDFNEYVGLLAKQSLV